MAETTATTARRINRPRLRTIDATSPERHASWLELFFDLVFVLAVSRVAMILAQNSDWHGFSKYAALFVPLWWCWVGYTFYADRFESDEASYRILMFAGMLAVAALALTLGGAFTPVRDLLFATHLCCSYWQASICEPQSTFLSPDGTHFNLPQAWRRRLLFYWPRCFFRRL
jgi:low temperature requirement protein LtrA